MNCSVCSKQVPTNRHYLLSLPEYHPIMWGPFCSDECISKIRVCNCCHHSFVKDKGEITHDGNNWVCNKCRYI